jgi:hypothetical protein
MPEYRRAWLPGVSWFFTMNLTERRGNRLLVERIDVLRTAFCRAVGCGEYPNRINRGSRPIRYEV